MAVRSRCNWLQLGREERPRQEIVHESVTDRYCNSAVEYGGLSLAQKFHDRLDLVESLALVIRSSVLSHSIKPYSSSFGR